MALSHEVVKFEPQPADMLQITVTNATQRRKFTHAEGPLSFGRTADGEKKCFVIDDKFVSREQFMIEESEHGKLKVDNLGRQVIMLLGGRKMNQGDSQMLAMPIRMTVGQTKIEIAAGVAEANLESESDATMAEEGIDSSDIAQLAIRALAKNYPFPLAYGFRLLTGITTKAELYKEQLRMAENIITYVASVSLALLDDEQFQHVNEKVEGSALSCWQGGISPGDWLTLAIHATNQLGESGGPLADKLVGLKLNKDKKGFGKTIRELIKAKNDFKHDRGPSIESEYREASRWVGSLLLNAFRTLSFLGRYKIRLIQDVNPRRRGQDSDVLSLICMGDHPGFETEKEVFSQNLRKGDLYIELEKGQLVPLYPFIHATTSSQTKAREFFFIDRLDKDRSAASGFVAGLKSFESGNVERDEGIGQELCSIFASN